MSKAKVKTSTFEPISTEFENEDLMLEVVEDISAGGEKILDKTGNRKYSKKLKCSRCDVTVQSKERLKRHEQISKGVQNIQTCNECSFTSCTSSGLKAKGHKCSKSADEKMIFVPHVEPKTTNGKVSLDSWANLHDFSEKTNIKQKINNDNDESYEAKQEFDNFDEQCSFDEEPKTKSGQKVARKQLSDSQLNFHDFSEETYNSNNDQGKNIKTSLSDIVQVCKM